MGTKTLLIGIDIGWSERQRSSAVAIYDPLSAVQWPKQALRYKLNTGSDGELTCCRFRFSELLAFLTTLRREVAKFDNTIVVVDGPLGPKGPPSQNRHVDGAFRSGAFNRRMQPSDVTTEDGRIYVKATYEAINAIAPDFVPWLGNKEIQQFCVTETNPTVGLALMNGKFDPEQLPTRKRPLVPDPALSGERAIRAKSDFYWKAGGQAKVAARLESDSIKNEQDHERIAGLYCLATAKAVSDGRFIACGSNDDGVYTFPCDVHSDWKRDLREVGILGGAICPTDQVTSAFDFFVWHHAKSALKSNVTDQSVPDIEDESEVSSKGNDAILLLNDNGGVWQKHNGWLEGAPDSIKVISRSTNVEVTLTPAAGANGQWIVVSKALPLAQAHGLKVAHLSAKNSIAIPIKILG